MRSLTSSICLGSSVECYLPSDASYAYVGDRKNLRVSIYCSTILRVAFEWSPDGNREGPSTMSRYPSKQWKSDSHPVIMPYLRLHVINESHQPCDELTIHTWEPGKAEPNNDIKKVSFSTPLGDVIEPVSDSVEHRTKSPFSRFRKKDPKEHKPVPQSPKVPPRDDRLPDFIPLGALLVGGDKGKITIIPKGNVGESLIMTSNGPCWSLPYPPKLLSEESKAKLANMDWTS